MWFLQLLHQSELLALGQSSNDQSFCFFVIFMVPGTSNAHTLISSSYYDWYPHTWRGGLYEIILLSMWSCFVQFLISLKHFRKTAPGSLFWFGWFVYNNWTLNQNFLGYKTNHQKKTTRWRFYTTRTRWMMTGYHQKKTTRSRFYTTRTRWIDIFKSLNQKCVRNRL